MSEVSLYLRGLVGGGGFGERFSEDFRGAKDLWLMVKGQLKNNYLAEM